MSEPLQSKPLRFSVITVCLNAADTIEETIFSVLNQNYPALEYIIIDGGSTDGTTDIIERHGERAKIVSEPDGGIYDAFNKGLAIASGDMVGIINADDMYAPWTLRTVDEASRRHPEGGVFYGKMARLDRASRKWTVYPLRRHSELLNRMIGHPAVFVRNSVYKKQGFFDDGYKLVGDWDFMLRLYKAGEIFCPIDKVLAAFGDNGASSRPSLLLANENMAIYQKYLPRFAALKKILKTEIKYWLRLGIDALGLYPAYARLRDKRLLSVEKSGLYSDAKAMWEEIIAEASCSR
ncbi:hypothetical protein AGMMS49957_10260 [Synergistales bacterium]|nr:hypothetical protein AGMMS49957_10260 [Synergistales bacterium]